MLNSPQQTSPHRPSSDNSTRRRPDPAAVLIAALVLIATGAFAIGVFTPPGVLNANDVSSEARRPLDLPSGGRGTDDEEEDAPETISYYGGEYEGDAFFWCLDRSGSMSENGKLAQLKTETTNSLASLSENAEFSLVAFSSGHVSWSPIPKKSNAANVASATAWVQALQADGWTCMGPAGVETVRISNMCDKDDKQVLVLSDGEPLCDGVNTAPESLTAITMANWQQTPINTIYIASDSGGVIFMQQLAALNNGTFSQPGG